MNGQARGLALVGGGRLLAELLQAVPGSSSWLSGSASASWTVMSALRVIEMGIVDDRFITTRPARSAGRAVGLFGATPLRLGR